MIRRAVVPVFLALCFPLVSLADVRSCEFYLNPVNWNKERLPLALPLTDTVLNELHAIEITYAVPLAKEDRGPRFEIHDRKLRTLRVPADALLVEPSGSIRFLYRRELGQVLDSNEIVTAIGIRRRSAQRRSFVEFPTQLEGRAARELVMRGGVGLDRPLAIRIQRRNGARHDIWREDTIAFGRLVEAPKSADPAAKALVLRDDGFLEWYDLVQAEVKIAAPVEEILSAKERLRVAKRSFRRTRLFTQDALRGPKTAYPLTPGFSYWYGENGPTNRDINRLRAGLAEARENTLFGLRLLVRDYPAGSGRFAVVDQFHVYGVQLKASGVYLPKVGAVIPYEKLLAMTTFALIYGSE